MVNVPKSEIHLTELSVPMGFRHVLVGSVLQIWRHLL